MNKSNSQLCYNINYHIVFCPKRRKPVLVDNIILHLNQLISDICTKNRIELINISIMPDYIHLVVSAPPDKSPHWIVKTIKGGCSGPLRKDHEPLRKLPCLWASSYYIGTVGFVSESTIKMFIDNQKGK